MSIYSAIVTNTAFANTTNDIMTLTPGANLQVQLVEVIVCGMGTASQANELGVYSVGTAGVTGASPITPGKFSFYAPASGSTVNTAWTTQPVVTAQLLTLSCNANGGIFRWVARPGEEIYATAGSSTNMQISLRAKVAGGAAMSVTMIWVEAPF